MKWGGRELLYVFLYIITTALSVILVHFIGTNMPDMLMIFLATSYAIIFFHLINFNKIVLIYKVLYQKHKRSYFNLSITILIMWAGSLLIPVYFLPSSALISYFCITTAAGAISLYIREKKNVFLIQSTLLLINLCLFYAYFHQIYSGWFYVAFIVSTFIAGIAGYYSAHCSIVFFKNNFSTTQTLAIRFWLLWMVAFAYVIYDQQLDKFKITMLFNTLLIAIFSVIMPIYFAQKSIEKFGADKSRLCFGFTPITVVIFERIFIQDNFDYEVIFACIIPLILLVCSQWIRSYTRTLFLKL